MAGHGDQQVAQAIVQDIGEKGLLDDDAPAALAGRLAAGDVSPQDWIAWAEQAESNPPGKEGAATRGEHPDA